MTPLELLLALTVVFIWGTNFVVIKIGLGDFPPLLFATLRFAFAALPWIFFIRRPAVAWRYLIAFGLFLGVGQFGLLFIAMRADITPGLAFRVKKGKRGFRDYRLAHSDLKVTISSDEEAALYRIGADGVLDHAPETLGL